MQYVDGKKPKRKVGRTKIKVKESDHMASFLLGSTV